MKAYIFTCVFLFLTGFYANLSAQTRWYVDADADGAATGLSWEDAFTDLQQALSVSTHGDEIWLAEGIYKPTDTEDETISFELPSGVKLYGGFAGTETELAQRDWETHLSVLSGDIGIPDYMPDNSQTVVFVENADSATLVDGVVIRDGYADGIGYYYTREQSGGGMYCISTDSLTPFDITIRHTRFENNWADQRGGALVLAPAVPATFTLEHCEFIGNRADTIKQFPNLNTDRAGGAIFIRQLLCAEDFVIKNCTFTDNFAYGYGSAIMMDPWLFVSDSISSLIIDSCLFENNESLGLGSGGLSTSYSSATIYLEKQGGDTHNIGLYIRHCTFVNNKGHNGSGINYYIAFPSNLQEEIPLFIEDNVFQNNEGRDVVFYSYGASTDTFYRVTIRGNYFESTESSGVSYGDAKVFIAYIGARLYNNRFFRPAGGVLCTFLVHDNPPFAFFNNTCRFSGSVCFIVGGGPSDDFYLELYNNIFYNSSGGPLVWDWTSDDYDLRLKISHCLLGGIESEDDIAPLLDEVLVGEGMQYGVSDPGFVDLYEGDYNLQPCSAAVNGGSNEVWQTLAQGMAEDAAGRPRILDGTIDIGAYEADTMTMDTVLVFLPSCPGASDGAVLLAADGYCNQPPGSYEIAWEGGSVQSSFYIQNLPAGDYTFTLTDSHGRSAEVAVEMQPAEPPDLQLEVSVVPTLPGLEQGQVLILNTEGGHPPYTYLWDDGDSSAFHLHLAPGWHTVTITDALGCTWQQSWEVEIYTSSAEISEEALQLYPNPTTGLLYVSGIQAVKVELRDALGRPVPDVSLSGRQLDLSTLSAGIYIVEIEDSEGHRLCRRVCKE